jgi:hypothetical protein
VGALSVEEAHAVMAARGLTPDITFDVLAAIGRAGADGKTAFAREMVIRVLDQRDQVPAALLPLLQSLIREHGLFPYLRDQETLSLADRLAMEAYRPDGALGRELVFHSEQSRVYEHLMDGKNVILSAPTSFGKSRVVDAYLDARDFTNAVIVVPTIALMDETRRRLARLGGPGGYKVITHASQSLADRNLFVMTQERLLEYGRLPDVDFFVIDELYKLDPMHSDRRSDQLNIVFDRLLRTSAQFYLLGPNITSIDLPDSANIEATFIGTDFTTVATNVERVAVTKEETRDELVATCVRLGPGTIVFCRSPQRTREVAGWLLESGLTPLTRANGMDVDLDDAAAWLGEAYHPDWTVARALRAGIGIHHGKLPRAIGHHLVRLFNEERLPILLVTSTLIEGVNTAAKNMVVLDHIVARKKYDYFTFANIRGRSGRMSKHFVGNVVVFNPEPQRADLDVEIPVLSQSERTSLEILIQLPPEELTPLSQSRLAGYLNQNVVSPETLRRNQGVPLDAQLTVAERVAADPRRWATALDWRGYPTTGQVKELSLLLEGMVSPSGTVRTMKQLGAKINMLRYAGGELRTMVENEVANGKSADDALDEHLEFVRNYAQFAVPRSLAAVAEIARDVLGGQVKIADPSAFAGELENVFQPPYTSVLEEYGLPTPLTVKLRDGLRLDAATDLDGVLARLGELDPQGFDLGPFEQEMLLDTKKTL